MDNLIKEKSNLLKALFVLAIIGSVYFAVRALAEIRSYGRMGSSEVSTITLSGHGEVMAVPDIANISFTISKDAKTAKEAQDAVAVVEKKALDFLKGSGVAEKDIKTSNASVYPKYEYKYETQMMAPCNEFGCPPDRGKNVINGYTASETVVVKVRNADDAGNIMQGLGSVGVGQINGPDFAIDNEDGLKAEARKIAIDDAKEKAKVLAKDLGVRLGKIVTFSESGNYYPMYKSMGIGGDAEISSAPAELPKGENTISSDVTITYEIR